MLLFYALGFVFIPSQPLAAGAGAQPCSLRKLEGSSGDPGGFRLGSAFGNVEHEAGGGLGHAGAPGAGLWLCECFLTKGFPEQLWGGFGVFSPPLFQWQLPTEPSTDLAPTACHWALPNPSLAPQHIPVPQWAPQRAKPPPTHTLLYLETPLPPGFKEQAPPSPLRDLPRPSALSAPSARARLISQITSRKVPRPPLPSDLRGPDRLSAPARLPPRHN